MLYDDRAAPGTDTDEALVLQVCRSIKEAKRSGFTGWLYRVERTDERSEEGYPVYANEVFVRRIVGWPR